MHKTTQAAPTPPVRTENSLYRKSVLDSGLRIVSETIPHVRSVSLGIWADVGSRDEESRLNGISHFLEHMVFKGTKKRSIRDIAQSLESLGGYLNAFTTKEQTCFYARVLDEHCETAMDVLSDIMLHATFRKEELEKEKLVVIEELKNAEDDPEDIIHDYFEKAIFPTHSLGNPIIGNAANLRRFQRCGSSPPPHVALSTRRGWSLRRPGTSTMTSSCASRNAISAGLTLNGKVPARPQGPSRSSKGGYEEILRPINQAHICIGTIAYGIKHKDRYSAPGPERPPRRGDELPSLPENPGETRTRLFGLFVCHTDVRHRDSSGCTWGPTRRTSPTRWSSSTRSSTG